MTIPDSDHNLLIRMLETQAEMKSMLKMALERADKTDDHIESLRTRVDVLEKNEARQSGRAALIGTGFGTVAASGVTLITMAIREKLGF